MSDEPKKQSAPVLMTYGDGRGWTAFYAFMAGFSAWCWSHHSWRWAVFGGAALRAQHRLFGASRSQSRAARLKTSVPIAENPVSNTDTTVVGQNLPPLE